MNVTEEERKDEDRFIDTVKGYPMLYDTKHFQYRDMQLKEKTWGRIAKEFKMDKFCCKKRWRYLRDGYQRYMKNHRKEFTTSATISTHPLIRRYARLRFLDKVFIPRKPQQEVSSDDDDDDRDNDDEKVTTASVKQEIADIPFETEEYSDNTSERENIFVLQHDPIPSETESTNKTTMTQESAKKDDVEYFCLHVAEVLRKLPPVEKAKAKKQLNDVLFEYELMAAKSSSETPSTSMG